MHAAPRSAREIGEGMEFSSIVINSIVSGTAAALVSGVFQLVDTRNGSDYRRRQYFDSRKVDEYFVALEAYSTLVNSLYDLGAAMSGRKSPDDCEELDEKQKMIDRDRRGGRSARNCVHCPQECRFGFDSPGFTWFDACKGGLRVCSRSL